MNESDQVWRELAGPTFDELMRCKEAAVAHVFDNDPNIRVAAINICDSVWRCSGDADFLKACCNLALSDPDDWVRSHAIDAYGRAMKSSRDRAASRFLAQIVKDETNPARVRRTAYFALQEVQSSLSEEEQIVRRFASLMKESLDRLPSTMSERELRRTVLCGGRFPESVWDKADEIDWDFVGKCADMT